MGGRGDARALNACDVEQRCAHGYRKHRYGWHAAEKPFERTYRLICNLDDRYANGVHEYLKFVKFGYGRASDHASKDVRLGVMSREQAVEMVRRYDHVVPSDLQFWLDYVDMSEEEFWQTADRFRDPRVWGIEGAEWWKQNLWGVPSAYGPVHLPASALARYQRRERVPQI